MVIVIVTGKEIDQKHKTRSLTAAAAASPGGYGTGDRVRLLAGLAKATMGGNRGRGTFTHWSGKLSYEGTGDRGRLLTGLTGYLLAR